MQRLSLVCMTLCLTLSIACGEDGADGLDGAAGAAGSAGADGADGSAGSAGSAGSDGSDGADGADGADGEDGEDGEDWVTEPEDLTVTITDVDTTSTPVVTFSVVDGDGEAFLGDLAPMLDAHAMRFTLAKLVPGVDGDASYWQSYINTLADTTGSTAGPDGVPAMADAIQATYEYSGTIEELADGEWAYTCGFDITAVTDPIEVSFDEDYLHRVAIQFEYELSSGDELISNPWYDFVPSGAAAPATRAIAMTDSCNECHDPLAIHGGGRIEMEYCTQCHNPGTVDPNSGNNVDMALMTHKIHMGHSLPSVDEGGMYTIWGYYDGEHDYSHVGYPQAINNCAKCHSADDKETVDGDNWNLVPNMNACGACHDDVVWADGTNHDGGAATDNSQCALCHSSDSIMEYHVTNMATPNNPELSDGLWDVEYDLLDAAVDGSNVLTLEFAIYADGAIQDWTTDPTGGDRSPSLRFSYAMAQDGIDAPADWNNLGMESGQPDGPDLVDIIDEGGTMTCDSTSCIATIADAFPVGATLRTVHIQGYMYQVIDDESYALHTPSKFITVTGDEARRVVVDNDKCANCHEYFEAHGGNRVYETTTCIACHNVTLSTTGRTEDVTNPEDSNNMKDMIHGIHGGAVRDTPMEFYRSGSYGGYYAWITHDQLEDYPDGIVVAYPGDIGNCEACHIDGTYMLEEIPADAILSIAETLIVGEDVVETYELAHESVPNDEDLIYSPAVGACASCHNGAAAVAHMEQNGGAFMWTRSEYMAEMPFESCTVCHGEGSAADVTDVHGL